MKKLHRFTHALTAILMIAGLSSASVSAASLPKASDMTADSCSGALKPFSTDSIRSYGKDRVAARQNGLKVAHSLIVTAQSNVSTYNKKQADVQSTLNKIAGIEKTVEGRLSPTTTDPNYPIQPPQTNMQQLAADYNNAKTVIKNSDDTLSSSKSSRGQIINATCNSIFSARVFSTVQPEARAQYIISRVDNISLSNSINNALYQATKNMYLAKTADPDVASDQALKAQVDALTDPQTNFGALNAAVTAANQQNFPSNCAVSNSSAIKCLDAQLTTIKQKIVTQSKQSQAAFKAVSTKRVDLVKINANRQTTQTQKQPSSSNSSSSNGTGGALVPTTELR